MMVFKVLFSLCVFLLSLGQIASISKQGFTNLYLFDFALALFVLYGIYFFVIIKKSLVLPSIFIIFAAFSFIALLSLFRVSYLYNNEDLLVSFLYFVRWTLYLFVGLITFNLLHHKILTKEFLINNFIYSGVFISLVGLIQLFVFPDLSIVDKSLGWDPHKNRLFSTFLDPNFVGAYFNIILVFLFDKYYSKQKFTFFDTLATFILLVSLILTFSRSAWLMLAVIIFIYGVFKSKLLLVTFLIVCFAAYFAIPRIQTRLSGVTDPSDSAHFRLISWSNTLNIAQDNLFLGVGFNTFRFAQKEYGLVSYDNYLSHGASGSDSSLLFVLATTGIFGIMTFLGGFVYVFFNTKSVFFKALFGSLLLESFFINSLFYPQILFIWIILIISYSLLDK